MLRITLIMDIGSQFAEKKLTQGYWLRNFLDKQSFIHTFSV